MKETGAACHLVCYVSGRGHHSLSIHLERADFTALDHIQNRSLTHSCAKMLYALTPWPLSTPGHPIRYQKALPTTQL